MDYERDFSTEDIPVTTTGPSAPFKKFSSPFPVDNGRSSAPSPSRNPHDINDIASTRAKATADKPVSLPSTLLGGTSPRSLTSFMRWNHLIIYLTLLFLWPLSAAAQSTTLFKDGQLRVEISSDRAQKSLVIWDAKDKLVEVTKQNKLDHWTVLTQFPNGESLFNPFEWASYRIHFEVSNENRRVKETVYLGESGYKFENGELTKYGFIKLLGSKVILFPSGNLAINTNKGTALLFIDGRARVSKLDELSTDSVKSLSSLWKSFEKYSEGPELAPISVTNFSDQSASDPRSMPSWEDKALRSSDFASPQEEAPLECKELPPCCCGPDHKGPCYNWLVYAGGASGGLSGLSGSSSSSGSSPWEGYPCHKNVYIFDPKGLNPKKQTKKLAELIKQAAAACGPQSRGVAEGYCWGGKILWGALNHLGDAADQLDVARFYSTPFFGSSIANIIVTNLLTFGLINAVLGPDQRKAFVGGGEPGPVEPTVPTELYIGERDQHFNLDTQLGPIRKPLLVNVDAEADHYNNVARNRPFVTCCGDGVINGSETCEANDEGQQCDNFAEEFTGVCRDCKCRPGDTASPCKCLPGDEAYAISGGAECLRNQSDPTADPTCLEGYSLVKRAESNGEVCWCERNQIPLPIPPDKPTAPGDGMSKPNTGQPVNPAALTEPGSTDATGSISIDSGTGLLLNSRPEGADF